MSVNLESIKEKIRILASKYSSDLNVKMKNRESEMKNDNKDHFLIYNVLGITNSEGDLIDIYQNKGRFLYRYAGSFLEDVAHLCFVEKFGDENAKKIRIENTLGKRPKTYEIDCLVNDNDAHEIKWRDATTDGDHITKEDTRIKVIKDAGYVPIRVMFFYPNRKQAIKIQETLQTLYAGVGGQYYFGNSAWEYIKSYTGIDLLSILKQIAEENTK